LMYPITLDLCPISPIPFRPTTFRGLTMKRKRVKLFVRDEHW
jgi:hypothetical protein